MNPVQAIETIQVIVMDDPKRPIRELWLMSDGTVRWRRP